MTKKKTCLLVGKKKKKSDLTTHEKSSMFPETGHFFVCGLMIESSAKSPVQILAGKWVIIPAGLGVESKAPQFHSTAETILNSKHGTKAPLRACYSGILYGPGLQMTVALKMFERKKVVSNFCSNLFFKISTKRKWQNIVRAMS